MEPGPRRGQSYGNGQEESEDGIGRMAKTQRNLGHIISQRKYEGIGRDREKSGGAEAYESQ